MESKFIEVFVHHAGDKMPLWKFAIRSWAKHLQDDDFNGEAPSIPIAYTDRNTPMQLYPAISNDFTILDEFGFKFWLAFEKWGNNTVLLLKYYMQDGKTTSVVDFKDYNEGQRIVTRAEALDFCEKNKPL